MRERIHSVAMTLLGVIAIAWPFGHFQHLPITGMTVTGVAGAALVLLWMLDLLTSQRPRLPFELFWPPVLAAAIAAATQIDQAPNVAGCAVLFLATVHFARKRDALERFVWWSGAMGLLWSIPRLIDFQTLMGAIINVSDTPPTFNTLGLSQENLAHNAAALLVVAAVGAACLDTVKRASALIRTLAIVAIAYITFMTIVYFTGLLIHVPSQPVATPDLIVLLVLAWLAARVAAKVLVERTRKPDGRFLLATAPLIAAAATTGILLTGPMAWHAWAAGIAAGYVIRDKRPNPETIGLRPGYAVWIVAPFVLLNVFWVNPSNPQDPRNRQLKLQRDYKAGNINRFQDRLAYYDVHTPGDPMVTLWHARLALDENRPSWAAAWVSAVAPPYAYGRLPVDYPEPTQTDRTNLLNRLRDQVSAAAPERRGLAYERALIAHGDTATAEASLRLRIAGTNPVYEEIDATPLRNAATFLAGAHSVNNFFDNWSVAELLAVLELVNARIEPAAEGVDRSWLPLAIAVRRDTTGFSVQATTSAGEQTGSAVQPETVSPDNPAWPAEPWQIVELPFDSSWQVSLRLGPEVADRPVATVVIAQDGQPSVSILDPLPDRIPDESTVFVWLP